MPSIEALGRLIGGEGADAGLLRATLTRPVEKVIDQLSADPAAPATGIDAQALEHGEALPTQRIRLAELADQVPDDPRSGLSGPERPRAMRSAANGHRRGGARRPVGAVPSGRGAIGMSDSPERITDAAQDTDM